MTISIAMCTFNGEHYIEQQLESFVRQETRPHELVVCDDCSTDRTLELLAAFAKTAPFTVRIYQNDRNLGSTRNFAKAILLCESDLIALSDQDDIWKTEKLSVLAKALEKDVAAGGVFSNADLIDDRSRQLAGSLWESIGYTNAMQAKLRQNQPFKILKKTLFVTGGTLMFRSDLRKHFREIPRSWVHDGWITWKLATHSKLVGVPLPLISYRLHSSNQIGVSTKSAGDLLRSRTATQMKRVLEKEIQQLGELLLNTEGREVDRSSEAQHTARQRTLFLRLRLKIISKPRLVRPLYALAAWADYTKFSKGWRSVIGDLVL